MTDFHALRYTNEFSTVNKLMRVVWEFVWLVAFRPTPRWTLHGWRRFLLRLFGARVGTGCRIAPSCRIWAPWNLIMGEFSALADGVDCYSMGKVTIGSKVAVSQRSFICAGSHDTGLLTRPLVTGHIVIEDHVWIAAECFIHPNVVIGAGTVIGARSVVLRDMPSWSICSGNPCKKIKDRILKNKPLPHHA